ncbi:MAG: hypothetical protein Q9227_003740 [Pyrenula ochraceoflavens]
MATRAIIPFLVAMMLVTGVCNTLLTKYQDMQCVRNCKPDGHGRPHNFEQPVIQTVQMFIGETGCWLVVFGFWLRKRYLSRNEQEPLLYRPIRNSFDDDASIDDQPPSPAVKPLVPNDETRTALSGWKTILLALPACCDITGTTLMNVGLLFVAASIYQMTRGALVLFVGLFSVLFLHRKLHPFHWFALFVVVLGVAIVGLAGALFPGDKNPAHPPAGGEATTTTDDLLKSTIRSLQSTTTTSPNPDVLWTILGVLMIAFAQIFTASQFCLEEWILEHYALEPLKVVGWEGIFGLLVTLLTQLILHFVIGTTSAGQNGYFDASEGYREIFSNRTVGWSSLAIMVSIGGFNFFGLSVTRSVSATSRSTIDTCRTLFIWLVSLGLGWESFKWLQVLGFGMLVYGTFLFNEIVRPPLRACLPRKGEEREAGRMGGSGLLPEEPIEHL